MGEFAMRSDDMAESVWDYPRPPRLEAVHQRLIVIFGGKLIADTLAGYRVLEKSYPPTYYFPPSHVAMDLLHKASGTSLCEYKGIAEYLSVCEGQRISERAAWSYSQPTEPFTAIAGYIAFYPSRVEACFVGERKVVAQQGDFYGGWITSDIRGPFKGGPGTWGW